ncbi:Cytochrome P450 2L1 [Armadillidium nasatum]|uniref:Cytochrome P450 2L1 n=1 Tax=Armadillidium nasatum TaxID=96803 RepID=A0A5N5SIJ8_9CRUS|nr:Cytochrome P450 2L1 [Armadillidium nasatum]
MILEIFLFFFAIFLVTRIFKKKGNLPPGPIGFPYFGTFFHTIQLKNVFEVKKKYGNIFMINIGVVNFLYICDFKIAKDSFTKLEFADRPSWKSNSFFQSEKREGKASGSGGSRRRLQKADEGAIKTPFLNKRCHFKHYLATCCKYEFKDEEVKSLMAKINEIQEAFLHLSIPDFFPVLKYILPTPLLDYITGASVFDKACLQYEDMVQPIIDEHLKTLDPNNPRDLMDDYLIEMKEKKNEEYSHFNITDLIRVTFDLFVAGNDTTSNMTRFFLTYMARFQEIQEKIQKEIDKVVPRGTLPGLQHRNELSYLDAAINEVQRHCSMISMGVVRYTTADVKVDDYDIPKGTAVISVAALSHKDPTYFKDPEVFDPSRFLDKNGKCIPTCEGFQAFGIGKRQCLGEQFARMELYLITAALLQNFTFAPPDGERQMSIKPISLPIGHFPRKGQKFSIKCRN